MRGHLLSQHFAASLLALLSSLGVFLQPFANLADVLVVVGDLDEVDGITAVFISLQDVANINILISGQRETNHIQQGKQITNILSVYSIDKAVRVNYPT
jgi:hypothetical protein